MWIVLSHWEYRTAVQEKSLVERTGKNVDETRSGYVPLLFRLIGSLGYLYCTALRNLLNRQVEGPKVDATESGQSLLVFGENFQRFAMFNRIVHFNTASGEEKIIASFWPSSNTCVALCQGILSAFGTA